VCAVVDRYVVDGAVNFMGYLGRSFARICGWNDRNVVDRAVEGAGMTAQLAGRLLRLPQTGRIRNYVMGLVIALVAAVAVAAVMMRG
jgi:hypothetical protein